MSRSWKINLDFLWAKPGSFKKKCMYFVILKKKFKAYKNYKVKVIPPLLNFYLKLFLTKAQGKKIFFGSSFKTCLEKLKKNLIFSSFTNPRLESYRFQKFTYWLGPMMKSDRNHRQPILVSYQMYPCKKEWIYKRIIIWRLPNL